MEKLIKMYKGNGAPFPNELSQAVLYTFRHERKRMGSAPTITATVMHPTCLDNLWDDTVYVYFSGERFYIDSKPSSSYSNEDERYKHEITLVSERRSLEGKVFTDGARTEFHFFGDLAMLVSRLNNFLNGEGMGYSVTVDNGITTDEHDVEIKDMYVSDVLSNAFEIFGIPYYFKGKVIHFGDCEAVVDEVFEYGVENALLSIGRRNANEGVATRITGVGGSDNIPYYYPNHNESGDHDITTTPSGYETHIAKVNYLRIDPYTSLRGGGWAKYNKATISPIGNDDDRLTLNITDDYNYTNASNSGSLSWSFIPHTESHTSYFTYNDSVYVEIRIYSNELGYKEISSRIKVKYPLKGDDNINAEIIHVKGVYTSSGGDHFWHDVEEDITDYTNQNGMLHIEPTRVYNYISVKLKFALDSTLQLIPNQIKDWNCYFEYNSNYRSGTTINEMDGKAFDGEYDVTIPFNEGQTTYSKLFKCKITRAVAGYSTASLNTALDAVFLNSNMEMMSEWSAFKPINIIVRDSGGDTIGHYITSGGRVQFRNNTASMKVYTIEMNIRVYLHITSSGITANGVRLRYNPDFSRYETDYAFWEFKDLKPIKRYGVFGIEFYNPDAVPDSLLVNFSATRDWIEPMENLMPKVYRDTLGENIWYDAKNNKYSDGVGGYIVFANEYNPSRPKDYIAEPKDSIKPSIVGMVVGGRRIDQFEDVAFDDNDSNDEWTTDEGGGSQTLRHPYFFVKLRRMDFNLFDHALETGEMTISMTGGHCGGCGFSIMVDSDTGKNTVQVNDDGTLSRDDDGDVITYGTPQESQQDTSKGDVWIALKKDSGSYGVMMPDRDSMLVPVAGEDTFVITNILLPKEYIEDAEKKLEDELLKDLKDKNEDKFDYDIGFSRIYLAEHEDVASKITENARIKVRYNGVVRTLYVDSYTYSSDADDALPQVSVGLREDISVKKNAIAKAEGRIIRYVNETVYRGSKDGKTPDRGVAGGTGQPNDIIVVQTTGRSETKVMSQKAVTDALSALGDIADIDISQSVGQSTTSVMSQKAVTDELQRLADDNEITPFSGIVERADVTNATSMSEDGDVYYIETPFIGGVQHDGGIFAYKDGNKYYTSWWNVFEYMAAGLASPISGKLFKQGGIQYVYINGELKTISDIGTPIWGEL